MLSYPEALDVIAKSVALLEPRACPLREALNAVAAEPIDSLSDVPPFANAAMDGFALHSDRTAGASETDPVRLQSIGCIAAGQPLKAIAPDAQAIEIMTGAPVPPAFDAIVPVERTALDDGGHVMISQPVPAGANIRRAGEDFRAGQPLIAAGTRLRPRHIMGLAASGADQVVVRMPPRTAVIATGAEIADAGVPEETGMIRDANSPYLTQSLRRLGIEPAVQPRADDRVEALMESLRNSLMNNELIITTGGVSAGRFDHVPEAIERIGGEILFHKVAIRPGKPVLLARLPDNTMLLGLPGNPVAVAACFRFFALPTLFAMQACQPERFVKARITDDVAKRKDFRFFAKAQSRVDETGRLSVTILPGQESFRIGPLMQSNCWAIVPEGADHVPAGSVIDVAPLYPTEFLTTPD